MRNCGYRICEIAKEIGTDPKTICKYLSQEDFSPVLPVTVEKPSILDPFKPLIREWLEDDKKHRRKQASYLFWKSSRNPAILLWMDSV